MKIYLSILLLSLTCFIVACNSGLVESPDGTMYDPKIYEAQKVQTIYFEIVDNPSYITVTPAHWSKYTETEIAKAREHYKKNSNKSEN